MAQVGGIQEREERPAWVRFVRIAVQDFPESARQGQYVTKDVDFAKITPPYSKDCFDQEVKAWFAQLEIDIRNGRINPDWVASYRKQYDAWLNGQELPLEGTAIRGWPVISPAQMDLLLHVGIRTVEDLAGANDEGMKRIGMGAMDLKNKARAWLAQRSDKAPLTMEISELKKQNGILATSLDSMTKKVEALEKALSQAQHSMAPTPRSSDTRPKGDDDDSLLD
jgi:hypothetical protein